MLTEKEMDEQIEKALNKVPFEIKKIKIMLFFLRIYREFKRRLKI
ncbi:hypothetical protein [Fusobacterium sp. PH5-44]